MSHLSKTTTKNKQQRPGVIYASCGERVKLMQKNGRDEMDDEGASATVVNGPRHALHGNADVLQIRAGACTFWPDRTWRSGWRLRRLK
jgi:hypothetical protein